MNDIELYNKTIFDSIKHINELGNEYWLARELQSILGYKEWRLFSGVIEKAQVACTQSNNNITSNFGVYSKIVKTGISTKSIIDYKLTRYACYLIVQNANPKFETVALGQTYFAVQTRKMELTEKEYNLLTEDEKRLYRRKQTRDGNKILYGIAKAKGVKIFDKFTNAGYRGLYNGEVHAIDTHYIVGKIIRKAIKELGGTMPEDLPTPEKSLKKLEKEQIIIGEIKDE